MRDATTRDSHRRVSMSEHQPLKPSVFYLFLIPFLILNYSRVDIDGTLVFPLIHTFRSVCHCSLAGCPLTLIPGHHGMCASLVHALEQSHLQWMALALYRCVFNLLQNMQIESKYPDTPLTFEAVRIHSSPAGCLSLIPSDPISSLHPSLLIQLSILSLTNMPPSKNRICLWSSACSSTVYTFYGTRMWLLPPSHGQEPSSARSWLPAFLDSSATIYIVLP